MLESLPFLGLTGAVGAFLQAGTGPLKLPFSRYVKAHHVSHAALSVCAVVAAIVFFVAGAGIRLLMGPISLGPLQQTLACRSETPIGG